MRVGRKFQSFSREIKASFIGWICLTSRPETFTWKFLTQFRTNVFIYVLSEVSGIIMAFLLKKGISFLTSMSLNQHNFLFETIIAGSRHRTVQFRAYKSISPCSPSICKKYRNDFSSFSKVNITDEAWPGISIWSDWRNTLFLLLVLSMQPYLWKTKSPVCMICQIY